MRAFVLLLLALLLLAAGGASAQPAVFQWINQIGGSGGQVIAGIATGPDGSTYVAGNTLSLDLPVRNAVQSKSGSSGLLRIDSAGASWSTVPAAGASAVSGLAASGNSLYAATPKGVLRSSDGGTTWTATGLSSPVNGIAADPSNPSVLYAALASGLAKSADGGTTWAFPLNRTIPQAGNGLPTLYRVWVDPHSPSVLLGAAASGLVRSADAGSTWQPVPSFAFPPLYPLEISFDPFTSGVLYAASYNSTLVSTDDGLTWSAMAALDSTYSIATRTILADPAHRGTLYAAGYSGLWKSTDGGATWARKRTDSCSVLAAGAARPSLYAACGNQILVSSDGFETATAIGPAGLPDVNALAAMGSSLFVGVAQTSDVFVSKLDPNGAVRWTTYFGGTNADEARAVAVDSTGAVYVTGTTNSADFPVSSGAYAKSGSAFLFKLNADGSLGYSTYFANGTPNAIAAANGRAYVAGLTYGGLAVTPGAYQTTFQGLQIGGPGWIGPSLPPPMNGFLTEFDSAGHSLVFSTYVGNQNANVTALALAADGTAVLYGVHTFYRLDATGSSLLATTQFAPTVRALAFDRSGNLYAAGGAQNSAKLQATAGAYQATPFPYVGLAGDRGNTGMADAFIARLDPSFNVVTAAVFGGEAEESVTGLAVAPNGDILAGGFTYSQGFPTVGTAQSPFNRATSFVGAFDPALSAPRFLTYTGDSRVFGVMSVAAASDGGVIFAGSTQQPPNPDLYGAPFTPQDATAQAFIVEAGIGPAAGPRIDSVIHAASRLAVPLSPGVLFEVRGAGFTDDAVLLLNGTALTPLSRSAAGITAAAPADLTGNAATLEIRTAAGRASIPVPVAPASPGIFTADGSGYGRAYILNADGTRNSPSNPAAEGSKITIFATGVGAMKFVGPYAVTDVPVDVFIDGFYANGIAAVVGAAPGLPGTVYQISVYVPHPADYAANNPNLLNFKMPSLVAVNLEINGVWSQAGAALSVGP